MLAELGIGGDLAVEVVLLDRGHADVIVGGTDHAELVGIHADGILEAQTAHQGGAHVIGPGRRDRRADQQFAAHFELRELIVRREFRRHLGSALGLRDLHQVFPAHALTGVLRVDRTTVAVHHVEHQTTGNIGVVRNGDEVDAHPLGSVVQPLPKIFWPVAVDTLE